MAEYYGLGEELEDYNDKDEKMPYFKKVPQPFNWEFLISLCSLPYVFIFWVYIYLNYLK